VTADAAEARVGSSLGGWRLTRLLGTGGMAAVYLGVHADGRRRAVKVLHPGAASDPMIRARFEREARAAQLVRHPRAIAVDDLAVGEDGVPFLVMDLLEGATLGERVRLRDGIETEEVLRTVDELLDVLGAAHAAGIVHRDIKLDNLFVENDGHLKVLDFGVAHLSSGAPALTRVGLALRTTPYMSPEQVRGERAIDGRSDLFAVGVLMFRLIARRKIHEAASEERLAFKMATLPAPPLASVAPEASRALCLVVDRALMFARDRRYPDAATMQRDVRALRQGQEPPFAAREVKTETTKTVVSSVGVAPFAELAPTRVSSRPPSPLSRRSKVWIVALGVTGIGAAAGLAFVELAPAVVGETSLTAWQLGGQSPASSTARAADGSGDAPDAATLRRPRVSPPSPSSGPRPAHIGTDTLTREESRE